MCVGDLLIVECVERVGGEFVGCGCEVDCGDDEGGRE